MRELDESKHKCVSNLTQKLLYPKITPQNFGFLETVRHTQYVTPAAGTRFSGEDARAKRIPRRRLPLPKGKPARLEC